MKCVHEPNLICDYSSTAGDIVCTTCPHYTKGIRETGGMPVLAWFLEKLKSLFKKLS